MLRGGMKGGVMAWLLFNNCVHTPGLCHCPHSGIWTDHANVLKLPTGLQCVQNVVQHLYYQLLSLDARKVRREAALSFIQRFDRNQCTVFHIACFYAAGCQVSIACSVDIHYNCGVMPAALSTARARAALASLSRMMVSVTTVGMPRSSMSSAREASWVSMTMTSRKSR